MSKSKLLEQLKFLRTYIIIVEIQEEHKCGLTWRS